MRARPLTAPARQLALLLRGECAAADVIDEALLDAAVAHGVAPLLYRALKDNGTIGRLPPALGARLALGAREAALYDEVQRRDLHQLLAALAADDVRPLLFKGAALASSHYAAPWLRPRGDADLLLTEADARRTGAVLEARGFERLPRPEGPHVTQARYQARVGGVQLAYDVHWRLAEPRVFAECLSFDELEASAVDTGSWRRLSDVHAILVACMHRVAHHHDTDQLIQLSIDRGLAAACLRGLTLASDAFGTPVPVWAGKTLRSVADDEPGARFLDGRLRRIDVLASDLGAIDSWRARIGLLRQHLFPSQDYMRATHGQSGALATLYARRIVRGARRWTEPLGKES
jgi:hypothetical protein